MVIKFVSCNNPKLFFEFDVDISRDSSFDGAATTTYSEQAVSLTFEEAPHYAGHHMEENVAANKGEDKATNQAEDEDDWDCEASSEDDDGDHIGPLNPKREDADVELG